MQTDPLHPETRPFRTTWLDAGHGHRLHVAEFGNPDGAPVLFLHGGPGSGCNPQQARLFDPVRCRLVQLDQRGCGQSTPAGALVHNDLDALIDDFELARQSLNLDRWTVYGGSWGGTLALAYARRHRASVSRLVLRAPFLARRRDLDHFFAPSGIARSLPGEFDSLCSALGFKEGHDIVQRLHTRLCTDQPEPIMYRAALAVDRWEAAVMGVVPPVGETDPVQRARRIARKRVYAHYCHAGFFLGNEGILDGLGDIGDLEGAIVHGACDNVCLPSGSDLLVRRYLPRFQLQRVADAGHGLDSTAMQRAMRLAIDHMLTAAAD
ncbi:MAG: alpha/beta fold hydrolase [Gammaproteobacteria bacterium]|nr:alpha/beta fold hydrolase [Gammaproteobacteria bacterium]